LCPTESYLVSDSACSSPASTARHFGLAEHHAAFVRQQVSSFARRSGGMRGKRVEVWLSARAARGLCLRAPRARRAREQCAARRASLRHTRAPSLSHLPHPAQHAASLRRSVCVLMVPLPPRGTATSSPSRVQLHCSRCRLARLLMRPCKACPERLGRENQQPHAPTLCLRTGRCVRLAWPPRRMSNAPVRASAADINLTLHPHSTSPQSRCIDAAFLLL
jgi:hypothetical protein